MKAIIRASSINTARPQHRSGQRAARPTFIWRGAAARRGAYRGRGLQAGRASKRSPPSVSRIHKKGVGKKEWGLDMGVGRWGAE